MLNKYVDRLQTLINEYRGQALEQFVGEGKNKPGFDDMCWHYIDPNTGRRTRILCCRHGVRGRQSRVSPELVLPSPYAHLLKVWVIEVCSQPVSATEKQRRVQEARKVLTCMKGDLYQLTSDGLTLIYKDRQMYASPFINFCMKNALMPKFDLPFLEDHRDRTGHSEFDKKKSKLPDTEAVIAIADIFTRVFEHVDSNGKVKAGETVNIRDAVVVTPAALSLASFNRMAAEIPVLPKQRLKSYSESNAALVYYLDWKGSKGYKDNKNHILEVLAGKIGKALNFFYEACEPGRILCRFYENSNQSLKSLLGRHSVAPERLRHLSLGKRPNLFQLGYALGFYGVDDCVSVVIKGSDPGSVYKSIRARCFEKKPIHALLSTDEISAAVSPLTSTSYASLHPLFGLELQPNPFGKRLTVTVAETQEWWVSHVRSVLVPEFPLSYTNSENNIHLRDAMFCIIGSDFYGVREVGSGGTRKYQKSKYSIVPLSALATSFTSRLNGNKFVQTIFEDYGYSSKIRLKPHSLRHFGNTLADMSEIPVEITTALSGRVDPEQTHAYIDTSHSEKADRVSAVINPSVRESQSIRVVSAAEISKLTNLPASVTSTGICTQDLIVTPCDFLNDFVSQCFMCPETCHVAGDEKAIDFLEKDLLFQTKRLESVECDPRLRNSQAMKQWYVLHSRNTHILSTLIQLMKVSPKGSVIRYSSSKQGFHLTDLPSKTSTLVTCATPDLEAKLNRLLEQRSGDNTPIANTQLQSLLSTFGISSKES
jgi:hypothetical protein